MSDMMAQLDGFFSDVFVKKAPAMPENGKKALVTWLPWISLIFGILGIPAIVAVFGLSAVATPFMMLSGEGIALMWVGAAIMAVSVVLELMAVSPLKAKKMQGWKYIYYANLVNVAYSLVHISVLGIIGDAIGLWVLYQIKSQYK